MMHWHKNTLSKQLGNDVFLRGVMIAQGLHFKWKRLKGKGSVTAEVQWIQGSIHPGFLSCIYHLPWKRRKIERFSLGVRFPSKEMELQSRPRCSEVFHYRLQCIFPHTKTKCKSLLWCSSGLTFDQTLTLSRQPYQPAKHVLPCFHISVLISPFSCAFLTKMTRLSISVHTNFS